MAMAVNAIKDHIGSVARSMDVDGLGKEGRAEFLAKVENRLKARYSSPMVAIFLQLLISLLPVIIEIFFSNPAEFDEATKQIPKALVEAAANCETPEDAMGIDGNTLRWIADILRVIASVADFWNWWNGK